MKAIMAAGLSLLLGGCATYGYDPEIRYTALTRERFAPVAAEVQLYFGPELPSREYARLGLIEVIGTRETQGPEMMALLKKKARELGADAVIAIDRSMEARERGVESPWLDLAVTAADLTVSVMTFNDPPPTLEEMKERQEAEEKYREGNEPEKFVAPVLSGVAIKFK